VYQDVRERNDAGNANMDENYITIHFVSILIHRARKINASIGEYWIILYIFSFLRAN
jgi:hypothetical protein